MSGPYALPAGDTTIDDHPYALPAARYSGVSTTVPSASTTTRHPSTGMDRWTRIEGAAEPSPLTFPTRHER